MRGLADVKKQTNPAPIADKLEAYTRGEVYFFVTFPDTAMHYPLIESYVYFGMNLSEEDTEDTWYFQPAEDFCRRGPALEGSERPVFCATKDQLNEFQDAEKLLTTLKLAASKRRNNR